MRQPAFSNALYRDTLDTLHHMAEIMEDSPHFYADVEEHA